MVLTLDYQLVCNMDWDILFDLEMVADFLLVMDFLLAEGCIESCYP